MFQENSKRRGGGGKVGGPYRKFIGGPVKLKGRPGEHKRFKILPSIKRV